MVWNVTWLSRYVSTIWASITGAVTSITGSLAKNTEPSAIARTPPVNLRPARNSRNPSSNSSLSRRTRMSSSEKRRLSRYSRTSASPAKTRYDLPAGRPLKKRLKVASDV